MLSLPDCHQSRAWGPQPGAARRAAGRLLSQSAADAPHGQPCNLPSACLSRPRRPRPVASCHTSRDASSLAASCCSCELIAASRLHTALRSACRPRAEAGWVSSTSLRPRLPTAGSHRVAAGVCTRCASRSKRQHPAASFPASRQAAPPAAAHLHRQLVVEDLLQRGAEVAVQRRIVQLALPAPAGRQGGGPRCRHDAEFEVWGTHSPPRQNPLPPCHPSLARPLGHPAGVSW